ncbi:MAG: hypothetical protein ACE5HJ_08815 [Thermoplasmata archaeon]
MPLTLNLQRLAEMSHELAAMRAGGVRTRRLGLIALEIMLSKAAASQIVERASMREEKERAQRAREFLDRLEATVVRMYATTIASKSPARRLQLGLALVAIFR